MQDTRPILTRDAHDVLVVGGGVAGIAAAVAASRLGATVLLMEKTPLLGGLATIGLISWYEPLCDGDGTQMISGIAEELLRLAIRYGFDDLPEAWADKSAAQPRKGRYATHYSPTIFALALDEYLEENGVRLRLDTWAVQPVMEDNNCTGLLCESAGGRDFFPAKIIIDATGDASVAHRAGMPTVEGENYLSYVAHTIERTLAEDLAHGGSLSRFRRWAFCGSDLYGKGHPEDMPLLRGTTGDQVTDFILSGRKLLFSEIKKTPRESRDIAMLPMMAQYRTVRRIIGAYEFTGREEGAAFSDGVGCMGDFRARGKRYQLPYRSLYCEGFPNLLAAGRIISATGDGWEITRVIPVAALSGQAAGVAAALCAQKGETVAGVDIAAVRGALKLGGVELNYPPN